MIAQFVRILRALIAGLEAFSVALRAELNCTNGTVEGDTKRLGLDGKTRDQLPTVGSSEQQPTTRLDLDVDALARRLGDEIALRRVLHQALRRYHPDEPPGQA